MTQYSIEWGNIWEDTDFETKRFLEDSEETITPPETHVETGMKTISMLRFFWINIDKLIV